MRCSKRRIIKNNGPLFVPPAGFPFRADSPIRQHFEPALILLFPMIAGLTVMKDEIAVAVSRHSSVEQHPWRRLFGTVDSAVTLVFGNEEESLAMARHIWELHSHIHGKRGSVSYDANNAQLQVWVLACVFYGVTETARRWTKPLSSTERAALYGDIKIFAEVFGIPRTAMPETLTQFDRYWQSALRDVGRGKNVILQTPTSRHLARDILCFNHPRIPKSLLLINRALSAVSLDSRLQARAHLAPFSRIDTTVAKVFDAFMGLSYAQVPPKLRRLVLPMYLSTKRKMHLTFAVRGAR